MKHQLVLASESPRRKQILEKAGFSIRVYPSNISETLKKNLNIEEQILDLARQKASTVFEALKGTETGPFLVLGSDTEVIFEGRALGKPSDEQEAYRILKSLSGQEHEVITAIWMIDSKTGQGSGDYEVCKVKFKSLTDETIWTYIQTGEPMDKAGAYGIQGKGSALVEKFEGPFETIMGLPIERVKNLIKKNQWDVK